MADRGSYGLGPRLDIEQLFLEAQHRWLRPAEICEILRNYQKFDISSESPNRPSSGSLFLFDRKVLRYFRKDGHNWRKKKDGKTVKEAHEKLKVGSVDVLHCYYAHGEDNENFQRRSYWMLEQELMHIVFVHYLEVKGSRTSNSPSSSFTANHNKEPSGNMDSTSPTSTLTSLCEDADSADSHHTNSRYQLFPESSQLQSGPLSDNVNTGLLNSQFMHAGLNKHIQTALPGGPMSYVHRDAPGSSSNSNHIMESQSLPSWEEVFEQCTTGYNGVPPHESTSTTQSVAIANEDERNVNLGESLGDGSLPDQSNWQIQFGNSSLHLQGGHMDTTASLEWAYELDGRFYEQGTHGMNQKSPIEPYVPVPQNEPLQNNHQVQLSSMGPPNFLQLNPENEIHAEGNSKHPFFVKQPLLDGEEGLKKVDSFSRWISKELGEVDDLNMRSSSGLSWTTVECGNVVDDPSLSPSLSQDQLFSITDFSPKWAYADSETEVHIIGKFLKNGLEGAKYNWSCMFGELEVPADILADGVLCCYAPPHNVARVPFYVTCSNRLACSEVREFDYRVGSAEDIDIKKVFDGNADEVHLFMRLHRLLSFRSSSPPDHLFDDSQEKQKLVNKLILLKEEDEIYQTGETTVDGHLSPKEAKEQLLERQMKEKLFSWLLHRISDGVKGPSMLDDSGQGALHLTAALGFGWAIEPIVTAGISINFRDVNGWTALHWAAFYGREEMVAILVSVGAATGLSADPSPEFPLGRTPADLASSNGHKGISGFLAESSLTSYLSSLTVKDSAEASRKQAVQTISERIATPVGDGDVPDSLSLKDSLTAISNATQAADRIYQLFRIQSFHRKKFVEGNDDGILDEHALSVAVGKARKSAQADGVAHAAAIQIQKKFRGWKKRKEFLINRQRIVKIQAHVRGHQVRKQYKTIIWSVGILEKVILRWRRKGSGLRGFRRDALAQVSNVEQMPSKEDDYDFLEDGRKQNEERQQKALSRVKSMFYDAEGRAQYRRLLTVAEKLRDTKAGCMDLSNPEEATDVVDDLIDIDSLLDDDTFMSIAFEGSH